MSNRLPEALLEKIVQALCEYFDADLIAVVLYGFKLLAAS